MRVELTPAELTVLGLGIERPQHGYDLEQVIEQRGMLHVPEAPAAAKSRRVFHATTEGRGVAARNALAFVAEARPVPHPLLVGVANLSLLSAQQYAQALRTRLAQIEARIAAVQAIQAVQQAQAPLPLAAREVYSYSLSLMEAERQWLATRVQVPGDEQN